MHLLPIAFILLLTATLAYRLPSGIELYNYRLHLNLTEAAFTADYNEYEGYILIKFAIRASYGDIFQFYAAHDFIKITSMFLNDDTITKFSIDNSTDILSFEIPEKLSTVKAHTIYINFKSRLSTTDMYGFYKTSYTINGVTKYMATTQFEPVYARRAFPCFDEPAFKVPFEIYITYPKGLTALSNMPGNVTTDVVEYDPFLETAYFGSTGPTSAYLIAFTISELKCSSGETLEEDGAPYSVCSRPESESSQAWALEIGPPIMRKLMNFTNIKYGTSMGFPEMRQLAIPNLSVPAMENWGLLTFREQNLLYDEQESTNMDKQNIATTMTHEFTHMWFGNLATTQWWSQMYLFEGLATYFGYFVTNEVRPDWKLDKQFVTRCFQSALEKDALKTSLPLLSNVNSTAEIEAKFNQITFCKGASLFRMIEHVIMNPRMFQKGSEYFLTSYSYRTTEPQGLWNLLSAQLNSEKDRLPKDLRLKNVLENWENYSGYPLLEVTRIGNIITIRQQDRFLYSLDIDNSNSSVWYVPISYTLSSNVSTFDNTTLTQWILPNSSVEIKLQSADVEWIILNNQATGFYRVDYANMWDNISLALRQDDFSEIPELNRAQLVDDAFSLARINKFRYAKLFDIIQFLENDVSHYPWTSALNGFSYIFDRVGIDSKLGRAMWPLFYHLFTKMYKTVSWEDLNENDHPYTLKQGDILSMMCKLGYKVCVTNALESFGQFKATGKRPSKNLRSIVYCNGLRYNPDEHNWNFLWNAYQTTEVAGEKVRILIALGCTVNETLLKKYLEMSLDVTSGIKSQDALTVFTSVINGNTVGINVALQFLKENHERIANRYQCMNSLRDLIINLSEKLIADSQVKQLRDFLFSRNIREEFHCAVAEALEIAEINLNWQDQHLEELNEYFGVKPDLPESSSTTTRTSTSISTSTTIKPTDSTKAPSSRSFVVQMSAILVITSAIVCRIHT